tara:strand:+ start:265 stop:549 length:285 start_codon:yes stop_codon:yes gene_type:complete
MPKVGGEKIYLAEDSSGGVYANCKVSKQLEAMLREAVEIHSPNGAPSRVAVTDLQISTMLALGFRVIIQDDDGACVDGYYGESSTGARGTERVS